MSPRLNRIARSNPQSELAQFPRKDGVIVGLKKGTVKPQQMIQLDRKFDSLKNLQHAVSYWRRLTKRGRGRSNGETRFRFPLFLPAL